MKDHIYRRLLSTHDGDPRLAERETTGRRSCCGFDCGCFDARLDAAIEAFAKAVTWEVQR